MRTQNSLCRIALLGAIAVAVAATGCSHQTESRASADASEVEALTKMFKAGEKSAAATTVAATFQHSGGYQTISGRIRFDGTAPARKSIMSSITKDREVCAPGGSDVLSNTLIVNGQNNGIKNVIVFLKTEKGREVPVHESAQKPAGDVPSMDNKACLFAPHITVVHAGIGSLPLKNLDPVAHNMNIQSRANRAMNSTIPANSSSTYEVTAEEPLPIAVSCTIHPWMKGFLHIRGNGYFAVTDENGNFKIENLPTGDKLTIQVWHEAAGGENGTFVKNLTIAGDAAKPAKGGFEITLDKDAAPGELDIAIPAAALPGA
jgi:plastocyanin